MRYRVRHETKYAYAQPVDLGRHMLHLLPRPLPGQRVVSASLVADPVPTTLAEGVDHFGNRVTWMALDRPHAAFRLALEAVVEVEFAAPPDAAATPGWEAVAAAALAGGPAGWEAAEFAFGSALAPADEGAGAYAARSFAPGRPVLAGLLELTGRIRREFTFKPGVTTISTPVSRVLAQRAGVCQDFTHLMIAGLRALGLPARYVSGYLRTRPPPGQAPRQGADQSHAWVGCWLGPGLGWVDLDPTNDLVVRDEHVVLGWGRDYGDISPVRGIILGGGSHSVTVGVDLAPVEG
jgi:transglutaminase-like putative cysteine protease